MKLKEIEERLDKINLKLIYKKDYNTNFTNSISNNITYL